MAILTNFKRGDTKLIKIRVRDKDDSPVDISGWIIYVSFKIDPISSDTAPGNISVKIDLNALDDYGLKYRDLNTVAGSVVLRIGPEYTKNLLVDTYHVDIQRVLPILDISSNLIDHDVWTLMTDTVQVLNDVTRTYSQGTLGVPIP